MTNRCGRECVSIWNNDFHVGLATYMKVKLAGNFFVGSSVRLCPVTDLHGTVNQQGMRAVSHEELTTFEEPQSWKDPVG